MKKKNKYKVGDKIVELGQVFRIFKIKEEKNDDGELGRVIFFKPYYKTEDIRSITCSIPEKNIEKTFIRRPITREELKDLVVLLKKSRRDETEIDVNKAKTLLKTNDPADAVKLIYILQKEKKREKENFSKSKKGIFKEAIELLVQEFALVDKISLDKAREKIHSALQ